MSDTYWADTSKWQCPVNDSYPHPFFAFKCSDGGDVDPNCAKNHSWSKSNSGSGKQMVGYAGYHVYRVGEDNLGGVKRALGSPNPYMTIMLDVEDWEGEITTNQSGSLNKLREQLIDWLGGSRARVFGYANTGNGNMQTLWPDHDDTKFVIPNYSGKPSHEDMIAHQYADDVSCKPFGPCDANVAYGCTPAQWAAKIGLSTGGEDEDMPKQLYLYNKSGQITNLAKSGTWYCVGWDADLANTGGSSLVLPSKTTLFSMSAWLYCSGMSANDNLYWRVQTLDRNSKELAKFPVGEIRGTTGDSDLQFAQVGSVSGSKDTNLRILVASTADNTKIMSAWWRTLYW